jgi:hypothetical protein
MKHLTKDVTFYCFRRGHTSSRVRSSDGDAIVEARQNGSCGQKRSQDGKGKSRSSMFTRYPGKQVTSFCWLNDYVFFITIMLISQFFSNLVVLN